MPSAKQHVTTRSSGMTNQVIIKLRKVTYSLAMTRRTHGEIKAYIRQVWRKLHSDELHGLYSSPNIVRMIKSRRMRWEGHVARMGGERCLQSFGWEARRQETTGKTRRG
jgi:hypothetical protein